VTLVAESTPGFDQDPNAERPPLSAEDRVAISELKTWASLYQDRIHSDEAALNNIFETVYTGPFDVELIFPEGSELAGRYDNWVDAIEQ
jgi:hypothetical protein